HRDRGDNYGPAGQLDAAYVGPNPAINAWQKSGGSAIKIISDAATGGASIVVKNGITTASQLKGKTLATPSLGNTQDVALRAWLEQNGLATTSTGGGTPSLSRRRPTRPQCLSSSQGRSPADPSPRPTTSRWSRTQARCCLAKPASPPCSWCRRDRQAAQGEHRRGDVQEDHLHQRPGRVLADE
ncbi:MAG: ABC transporter substrate-binding protein, partial [Streptosporangiaceae bacterium]